MEPDVEGKCTYVVNEQALLTEVEMDVREIVWVGKAENTQ
jgi:hypothetical protein